MGSGLGGVGGCGGKGMATPCPYGRVGLLGWVPLCRNWFLVIYLGAWGASKYTTRGELWAWRSYQVRIDLRCAVVSNVE